MMLLILGLVLFLGIHSARVFGEAPRNALVGKLGANGYKGLYSVLSLVGFVVLIYGYAAARQSPTVVWLPPAGMRHAAALLNLVAFIFLVAAYVPGNAIKAKLKHPMVLGVKVWAFAHLLSNGMLHDIVLFGAFLAWAALSFRAARGRDKAAGTVYPAGRAGPTVVVAVAGLLAWLAFAFWAHGALIGAKPFGV
jgi:uncharacterized membrane protein